MAGPSGERGHHSGGARTVRLTARQLAGQRVVYSYPGLTPPDSLLRDIEEGRAAGVVFFEENISDLRQIRAVTERLRQAHRRSPVRAPLLLMTDQEGGAVRRLPGPPELSARQVGESADAPAVATRAGTEAGHNLRAAGLNVNLAPVLDVYGTPDDFIDHRGRSYAQDPTTVAALGRAFLTAQQHTGVAATAKHFPGLGTAKAGEDTDLVPVTLPVPLAGLRAVDESPYPAAIAAGVDLVMLSWATYPALDAGRPAGLSPVMVQRELRGRLGYRGVTITDALEAGALGPVGPTARRAVAAADAGMDLVLCSARDSDQGRQATDALALAYSDGTLDPEAFVAAVDRITALRTRLA
ncbi:glycoside hydrolase family 3 N-terminal domain-containing protein [Kitasatospora sp. HPMI-4]|uniref:glycoside hydrolase family 3 N-terminal domain-containing protein n=1 Tax=Kitasatospora sp. HPMI-4 TaxID=3448443 RepID=UPI003F1E18B9